MILCFRNITLLLLTIMSVSINAQFVIGTNSGITVQSGTSMYIDTDLYIESDVTGSGHLADQNPSGDITITGDVTIERFLTQDGWHNISAPLNNVSSDEITGTDLIFYYDETIILNDWNFGWVWYDGPFTVMQGYDVFLEASITANYFGASEANLNTGPYSSAITKTDVPNGEVENRKGWNLLGNPYPCPVDWLQETGWNKSDINDAKYIWNPDNNNYTIFLGGVSPTGVNGGTRYIPSSQGFWVQAVQNGSVSIGNSARVGIADGTPPYYKESQKELRITINGNGYSDETLIRFLPWSSTSFDINGDASKLFTRHDSVPQIYTRTGKNLLAINSLPENTVTTGINLDFRCGVSGYYNMEIITNTEGFYLYDLYERVYYEINTEFTMDFLYNTSNSNDRFMLYYNVDKPYMDHLNPDPYQINAFGDKITISRNIADDRTGILRLFSVSGKLLGSYEISGNNTIINTGLSHGWYVASINLGNKLYNYKFGIF